MPRIVKLQEIILRKNFPSILGLFLIGLYCALASAFQRTFSHLHLRFSFLDFPVFVSEILLVLCLVILIWQWKKDPPQANKYYGIYTLFLGWILIKAVYGYVLWGPLSFRNAALFYYIIFGLLGYEFAKRIQFSSQALLKSLLLILFFTKWVVGIHNYYVFPYFCLSLILVLKIENKWIKLFSLPFIIIRPEYESWGTEDSIFNLFFFFQGGGRARFVGHVTALSFLFFAWFKINRKIRIWYKIFLIIFGVLIAGFFAGKFIDRNFADSIINFPKIINGYQALKKDINLKRKDFTPQKLKTNLYSEEEISFQGEIRNRYKKMMPVSESDDEAIIASLKQNVDELKDKEAIEYHAGLKKIEAERDQKIKEAIQSAAAAPTHNLQPVKLIGKDSAIKEEIQKLRRENNERLQNLSFPERDINHVLSKKNEKNEQPENKVTAVVKRDPVPEAQKNKIVQNDPINDRTEEISPNSNQNNQKPIPAPADNSLKDLNKTLGNMAPNNNVLAKAKIEEINKKFFYKQQFLSEKKRKEILDGIDQHIEALGKKGEITILKAWTLNETPLENQTPKAKRRDIDDVYNNSFFRLVIWNDMIDEFLKHGAWFGMNFGRPQRSTSIEILNWTQTEILRDGWITPHNSFLHIIYRGGIIGLGMVVAMFLFLLTGIKNFLKKESFVGVLISGIFIYWFILSNFLVFLEFPYNAIPFWTLAGIALAYHNKFVQRVS